MYYVVVLKVDGKIEWLLDVGVLVFWCFNCDVVVELVDLCL